jgi:hypothetical protein
MRPGFDGNVFSGNDDGSTGLVPIGFPINFFGRTYSQLYLNNNGNLTFDNPLSTYTPFNIITAGRVIIAPFFADVDTRIGNVVRYGQGTVNGRPAWGATWPGVGCYAVNTSVLNNFQVVLIDRSDTGPGNFDIEFNYDRIQWETGQASGGNAQCQRGSPARLGYSNGTTTAFELPGSGVSGYFLDSSPTGLINNSRDSLQLGRYVFPVRNGAAPTGGTISGAVYAGSVSPSTIVGGAPVQVCGSGGLCNLTQTNSAGRYTVGGLADGPYTVKAFPPASSNAIPTTVGPVPIAGATGVVAPDIILPGSTGLPPGTTITSRSTNSEGLPVVYWGDPLTLQTHGCPGGTASYRITLRDGGEISSGPMIETPAGSGAYTASIPPVYPNHGYAQVTITITCPGGGTTDTRFDIYIDPSGVVRTTTGTPIVGARVTLYRSDASSGPFVAVPNGSAIMSPANRTNPDLTDAAGHFGWDVIPGYYRVRAEKADCHAPGNPAVPYSESAVLTIPPPVTDLDLRLECPVSNRPPVADAGPDAVGNEGAPIALTGGASDPDGDSLTLAWSYTPGPGVDAGATCTFSSPGAAHSSITCTDDGVYTATLAVMDGTNPAVTDSAVVTVANVPPTATFVAPSTVAEGAAFGLSLTGAADVSAADNAAGFTYAFDCGGGYGAFGGATTASCPTDDDGMRTVKGKVRDKDGGESEYTALVAVTNAAPTVAITGAPATSPEGTAISLGSTVSDPSTADTAAGFSYAWSVTKNGFPYGAAGSGASYSFTPDDNGAYVVTLNVTDKDGGTGSTSQGITITNVAPTATITGPAAGSVYAVGTPVTLTAIYADPGTADTHTAQWTFDALTASGPASGGSVNTSYTFTSAGVYKVKLTVTDDDGGMGTADAVGGQVAYVVVYDPSAGFVTGGGWINSPAGAYSADPSLSGRANFGFVSKYQKGATIPTGQTEFQFKAGNLNFQSSAYQWLVVSGARAQYKGTGTVNGQDGYSFLLTATDGQVAGGGGVDKIRLKIWNAGGVVYDNLVGAADELSNGQAIAGGSIVIHSN